MSFEQLVAEIKKLSPGEQMQLKDLLNEEVGIPSDLEMDQEHLALIDERMLNPAPSLSGDEVLARVRQRVDEA